MVNVKQCHYNCSVILNPEGSNQNMTYLCFFAHDILIWFTLGLKTMSLVYYYYIDVCRIRAFLFTISLFFFVVTRQSNFVTSFIEK